VSRVPDQIRRLAVRRGNLEEFQRGGIRHAS
jgi:hypothetical protein